MDEGAKTCVCRRLTTRKAGMSGSRSQSPSHGQNTKLDWAQVPASGYCTVAVKPPSLKSGYFESASFADEETRLGGWLMDEWVGWQMGSRLFFLFLSRGWRMTAYCASWSDTLSVPRTVSGCE